MIQVRNLTFEYPARRALFDVYLDVAEGSVAALVGPNGAGKTTLLRCMAGLARPYRGEIRIGGVDAVAEPRQCHRIIGYLPDFFGLYDALTVAQTLTYFARAHRVAPEVRRGRIAELLTRLHLSEKAGEKVKSLSRGMRQRLAIGQAMIHDPSVLLLDEPASGLDPESRYALSELFRSLQRAGKTLIISSHILAELDQYATDLLILREGRMVERRPLAEPAEAAGNLRIRLLAVPENLPGTLADFPLLGEPEVDGDRVTARFTGTDAERHELLAALLKAGLPITDFHLERENLQSRYLESLGRADGGRS